MQTHKLTVLAACLLAAAALRAAPAPGADSLSLRERVGQTIMPRVVIGQQKAFKQAVLKGEVTGFFIKANEGLVTHPEITAKNQARFVAKQRKKLLKTIRDLNKWAAKSPHQIPLLLAIDYEGGTVTSPMYLGLKQMPSNMLLAASGDEKIVADAYAAQAREILLAGANTALGPVTDVNSNPLNPIIQTRSFGDDAARVGRFSAAAVRALENNGVPAFVKHFPGHGDTSVDSHYTQPVTDLPADKLWSAHISAFQPAVDAGVTGVMSAHVVYPALDKDNSAMFSTEIMQRLLRRKMGFKGLIATDGLDMGAVKGVTVEEIVRRAYGAGNNILLLSGDVRDVKTARTYPKRAADYVEGTLASARPEVSGEFILESAQKVLDLKERLGLFEDRAAVQDTGFDEASRRAAQAGVTLVRDEQRLIPLGADKQTVCAVFFADDIFSLQLKAFTDELSARGKTVRSVFAPRTPGEKDALLARQCLSGADVLAVGTSRTSAMDARQRQTVNSLLESARKQGTPAVLVSLLNPYEIPLYPQARTVLALYGPTVYTAQTAAQILLGDAPAKGRLPVRLE